MKTFNNIASLIKTKRTKHKNYSQTELASLLGLKSDYLIANIERGKCGVPLKSISKISHFLEIHPDELKSAVLKDHQESLDRYFHKKV